MLMLWVLRTQLRALCDVAVSYGVKTICVALGGTGRGGERFEQLREVVGTLDKKARDMIRVGPCAYPHPCRLNPDKPVFGRPFPEQMASFSYVWTFALQEAGYGTPAPPLRVVEELWSRRGTDVPCWWRPFGSGRETRSQLEGRARVSFGSKNLTKSQLEGRARGGVRTQEPDNGPGRGKGQGRLCAQGPVREAKDILLGRGPRAQREAPRPRSQGIGSLADGHRARALSRGDRACQRGKPRTPDQELDAEVVCLLSAHPPPPPRMVARPHFCRGEGAAFLGVEILFPLKNQVGEEGSVCPRSSIFFSRAQFYPHRHFAHIMSYHIIFSTYSLFLTIYNTRQSQRHEEKWLLGTTCGGHHLQNGGRGRKNLVVLTSGLPSTVARRRSRDGGPTQSPERGHAQGTRES